MDDIEDDGLRPPNPSSLSAGHESTNPQRIFVKNVPVPQNVSSVSDDDDEDDDEDIDEQEEENDDDDDDGDNNDGENGVLRISNTDYGNGDGDNDEEDYDDGHEHPKKRKLKSIMSNYEFAPRMPAFSVAVAPSPRPVIAGRNTLTDWTENETFILLDAWGDKFLQHGRKSLRSEEWQEVSEKVSQESKVERSDTQCRNRLDTLKKKYKKEKMKMDGNRNWTSKWVYFKKLDMLLSTHPHQAGLSCGVDSGEYVFMSPKIYPNHANGLDEMRDIPTTIGEEETDSEGLPPKKARNGRSRSRGASFKLLADSIQKFAEVYEKTENNKSKQMQELENMRMDFQRELELQKRKILERAQAEIAKIRQGHDEQNDVSAENVSS